MTAPRKTFILASASPRRKQLLKKVGYRFQVCPSDTDESLFSAEGVKPDDYARQLALAKARDVARKNPHSLVLAADTIADLDGRVIGKPADAAHAEEIVRLLFSKPHKVITAVAIVRLSDNTQIVESDTTTVYPRKMSPAQIAEHIASHSWEGKAGAYAIQETGDKFVDHIDGSLTNVMGLPMELLQRLLDPLLEP
jgi:septum formation protein